MFIMNTEITVQNSELEISNLYHIQITDLNLAFVAYVINMQYTVL
jgi:hypothetical protein